MTWFNRVFRPRPPEQPPKPQTYDDPLTHPNVRAFLTVIRACEGTSGPDGYRMLFGGSLFHAWRDHPRVRFYEKKDEFIRNGRRDYTTAAGAYQITESTWNDFTAAKGPRDFTPASQDECAWWLIGRAGAQEDVLAGRLETAIKRCAPVWASLPGAPYGQPTKTYFYARSIYNAALAEKWTV
jgi:muramidase (phage lysozyme)